VQRMCPLFVDEAHDMCVSSICQYWPWLYVSSLGRLGSMLKYSQQNEAFDCILFSHQPISFMDMHV
jgi:hypothetical protein